MVTEFGISAVALKLVYPGCQSARLPEGRVTPPQHPSLERGRRSLWVWSLAGKQDANSAAIDLTQGSFFVCTQVKAPIRLTLLTLPRSNHIGFSRAESSAVFSVFFLALRPSRICCERKGNDTCLPPELRDFFGSRVERNDRRRSGKPVANFLCLYGSAHAVIERGSALHMLAGAEHLPRR